MIRCLSVREFSQPCLLRLFLAGGRGQGGHGQRHPVHGRGRRQVRRGVSARAVRRTRRDHVRVRRLVCYRYDARATWVRAKVRNGLGRQFKLRHLRFACTRTNSLTQASARKYFAPHEDKSIALSSRRPQCSLQLPYTPPPCSHSSLSLTRKRELKTHARVSWFSTRRASVLCVARATGARRRGGGTAAAAHDGV